PEVERRTDRALADLDLTAHAGHHPYDLPPALRKLAALAGALALEPALLVLDEPTIGLDRALRARVTRALLDRSAGSVALLVITHDLTFAAETLERGLVLDRGSLACDEPLAGLLGDVTRLEPLGLAPPQARADQPGAHAVTSRPAAAGADRIRIAPVGQPPSAATPRGPVASSEDFGAREPVIPNPDTPVDRKSGALGTAGILRGESMRDIKSVPLEGVPLVTHDPPPPKPA